LHRSSPQSFFVNYYFWNPSFHFQDFSFKFKFLYLK
jgi:hypothetical protein